MTVYEMLVNDYDEFEFAEFLASICNDPYSDYLPWSKYLIDKCSKCEQEYSNDPPCEVRECAMTDPTTVITEWLFTDV